MSVETKDQVDQFLILQNKTEIELRAISEGLGLKVHGDRSTMIDNILKMGLKPQKSILVAQAIPLRTRNVASQPIDAAIETFKKWRTMIFQGKDNRKPFQLLNGKGKTYTANLKYVCCSPETLQHILEEGWFLPLENNKDLISMLKQKPAHFNASIIQKPDAQGNSWLMLHIEPKKAA